MKLSDMTEAQIKEHIDKGLPLWSNTYLGQIKKTFKKGKKSIRIWRGYVWISPVGSIFLTYLFLTHTFTTKKEAEEELKK
jgi:hypothetical protein